MITVALVFIAATLLAALSGLIGDEVRGWLELAPRGLLRVAAMRLPVDRREAIYGEEWLPELLFIVRKVEGRPITRLVLGTWFAASMIRSAGRVARTLGPIQREGPDSAAAFVTATKLVNLPTQEAVNESHVRQHTREFDVWDNADDYCETMESGNC